MCSCGAVRIDLAELGLTTTPWQLGRVGKAVDQCFEPVTDVIDVISDPQLFCLFPTQSVLGLALRIYSLLDICGK